MERPRRIGEIVWEFLSEFWPQAVLALGSIGFASVGLILSGQADGFGWLFTSFGGLVFVVSAIFVVAGNVELWRRRPKIKELEQQVAEYTELVDWAQEAYKQQFRIELASILGESLGYGDTERISVYKHGDGSFQLLGRYSENPDYDRAGTRSFYPDDQGVVGRAWREGFASEMGLPDPEEAPDLYYERLEEEWSIDRITARSFTMQSRQLVGSAIYEPRGIERVAVIVVESTSVGIIKEEDVREALIGSSGQTIYEFLARARLLEPRPDSARNIGY